MSFKIWLVCVGDNGKPTAWFGGFAWQSSMANGLHGVQLTDQFSGAPDASEYDVLLSRNNYVWDWSPIRIHFEPCP